MITNLHYLCESLLNNKNNIAQYDEIVSQYISSVQVDSVLLTQYSVDESFPQFIQCLIFPLLRVPLPGITDGNIPPKTLEIIQFLSQIVFLNPIICKIVAANIPFDFLLATFFKRIANEKKGRRAHIAKYLPFVKFIALISLESDIYSTSTESLGYLLSVIRLMFGIQDISKWALAALAGLIHNCPTATSFIQTQPQFAKLRTDFAGMLSDDDPNVF